MQLCRHSQGGDIHVSPLHKGEREGGRRRGGGGGGGGGGGEEEEGGGVMKSEEYTHYLVMILYNSRV